MPVITTRVECPVHSSFRVQSAAGMFDVPLTDRSSQEFSVEIPSVEEPWEIGLITGPSGSGKTTIARAAFGPQIAVKRPWSSNRAVLDDFPAELDTTTIIRLLTSVGFSSPPAWVRPYHVLSRGEQFRCDLARALAVGLLNQQEAKPPACAALLPAPASGGQAGGAAGRPVPPVESAKPRIQPPRIQPSDNRLEPAKPPVPIVVFDEFTSTVDRNVARASAAAVSKAIRSGQIRARFVAVTCHRDVAEWLAPDWVADMATSVCQRRRLRRGTIRLELYRAGREAWRMFARHHYLSGQLSATARCYVALWVESAAFRIRPPACPSAGAGRPAQAGETADPAGSPSLGGTPVTFCATLPIIGRRNHWRLSRVVTLPDYQGMGIGMRVAEAVAQEHLRTGCRFNVTASHPALLAHCCASPRWRLVRVMKTGSRGAERLASGYRGSSGRAVASYEYLGDAKPERAERATN